MHPANHLSFLRQGKVRDVFCVDDRHFLIVASDRISAFDHVLPNTIPGKGRALTQLSNFWLARTRKLTGNHLVDPDPVLDHWPGDSYRPGSSPPSFDKQYVRDCLEQLQWSRKPPTPTLPADVAHQTSRKYDEALKRFIENPDEETLT